MLCICVGGLIHVSAQPSPLFEPTSSGKPALTLAEPIWTFGVVVGANLNVNYGQQDTEWAEIDYHHTALKPALGILLEYRISKIAYEANLMIYREEPSVSLSENAATSGRSYSSGLDGTTLYLPVRISKLTLDRAGRPVNKIFAGLGLSCLFASQSRGNAGFQPDLAEAVNRSFRRIRPHLNLGFEKFLGRLGIQLDGSIPLLPFDKKIRYRGMAITSKRSILDFSVVAVYRFYKKVKAEEIWY